MFEELLAAVPFSEASDAEVSVETVCEALANAGQQAARHASRQSRIFRCFFENNFMVCSMPKALLFLYMTDVSFHTMRRKQRMVRTVGYR